MVYFNYTSFFYFSGHAFWVVTDFESAKLKQCQHTFRSPFPPNTFRKPEMVSATLCI